MISLLSPDKYRRRPKSQEGVGLDGRGGEGELYLSLLHL